MSKKIYDAFQTAFLDFRSGASVSYKDIVAFCKENSINMDVIGFFDDIKDDIDDGMCDLGVSYDNDTLHGVGLKPTIKAYYFDDFEHRSKN